MRDVQVGVVRAVVVIFGELVVVVDSKSSEFGELVLVVDSELSEYRESSNLTVVGISWGSIFHS